MRSYSLKRRSTSASAFSRVYPYRSCKRPINLSRSPSIRSRSSSVRSPHHFLTCPRICFHFPFRTSAFILHFSSIYNTLLDARTALPEGPHPYDTSDPSQVSAQYRKQDICQPRTRSTCLDSPVPLPREDTKTTAPFPRPLVFECGS